MAGSRWRTSTKPTYRRVSQVRLDTNPVRRVRIVKARTTPPDQRPSLFDTGGPPQPMVLLIKR